MLTIIIVSNFIGVTSFLHLAESRVHKKEKRVSNCPDTVYFVPRSLGILLHRSQYSIKLCFVLQKGCLWTGKVPLFSYLLLVEYIRDHTTLSGTIFLTSK